MHVLCIFISERLNVYILLMLCIKMLVLEYNDPVYYPLARQRLPCAPPSSVSPTSQPSLYMYVYVYVP